METKTNYVFAPTFGESFGAGWKVMSDNFLRFLLVVLVLGIILSPVSVFKFDGHHNFHDFWQFPYSFENMIEFSAFSLAAAIMGFIGMLYNFLFLPVLQFGGKMMFVQGVRSKVPDFDLLIAGFRKNYLNIVLANLLMIALIAIGIICLIIPGIIISCRLVFTPYLVMDRGLDPIQAVEESWRITKGHGWTIFLMGFVSIFIFIAGLICLFFGAIISIMWIKSSFASLYQAVLIEKGLAEPATVEIA